MTTTMIMIIIIIIKFPYTFIGAYVKFLLQLYHVFEAKEGEF
jgi:hypothetical protein